MILCTALLLQGQSGLFCHKDAAMYGVTSVEVAMRICKHLYGDSVVPVCVQSSGKTKRLFFKNATVDSTEPVKKESEDEFWDRILADAARQLEEQRPRTVVEPRRDIPFDRIRRMPFPEQRTTIAGDGLLNYRVTHRPEEPIVEPRVEPTFNQDYFDRLVATMPQDRVDVEERPLVQPRTTTRRTYEYRGGGNWNVGRTRTDQ